MKKITLRRRITKPAENPQPRARHTLSLSHIHSHTCFSITDTISHINTHADLTYSGTVIWYSTHKYKRTLPGFCHSHTIPFILSPSMPLSCARTHTLRTKGVCAKGVRVFSACVVRECCARVLCVGVVGMWVPHLAGSVFRAETIFSWQTYGKGSFLRVPWVIRVKRKILAK